MRRVVFSGILVLALACSGCGQRQASPGGAEHSTSGAAVSSPLHARPQAIEPVAGAAGTSGAGSGGPSMLNVGPSSGGALAQPISDSQIRQQLAASGLSADAGQATLTTSGLALPPLNAPPAVQQVIAAGNEIARLPYRFGGGHGTFEDSAYDCSGSLSFAFAAAGLLGTTLTSGELMSWGDSGPGKWITVFAAPGHTFMYVAGLRFDTVALAQTGSRWSNRAANEPDLRNFVARHPPGL